MGIVPRERKGQLEFFEQHIGAWTTNATAVGLVGTAVTNFNNNQVKPARTNYDAAVAARQASKNATISFYTASDNMADVGRAMVATIKAYAETTNNPNVYALAGIPVPQPPTPVPAPDMPKDLSACLNTNGALQLTWTATSHGPSTGIFFLIARKRTGDAEFSIVSATAELAYIDPAAGTYTAPVQYQVKAIRGEDSSAWTDPITMNIGGGGGFAADSEAGGSDGGGLQMAA